MGSSDNRSLPGFSLPMWMKNKGGVDREQNSFLGARQERRKSYEFEDIVSSPPTNDESFFYLRYPQMSRQAPRQSMYTRINELVEGDLRKGEHGAETKSVVPDSSSRALTSPTVEITAPVEKDAPAMGNTTASAPLPSKSQSDSVVGVAQQMSKQMTIGPNVSKAESDKLDKPFSVFSSQFTHSLPPTPSGTPTPTPESSPRIPRKGLQNPHHYFTGSTVSEKAGNGSGASSSGGGWFFSGLLTTNSQQIATKDDTSPEMSAVQKELLDKKFIRRAESAQAVLQRESLVAVVQSAMTNQSDSEAKSLPPKMRPKPTELREMNFWSPTSM